MKVKVHPRVCQRHPDISELDVFTAWDNCLTSARRHQSAFDDYVAIGFDTSGRLIEMIAVQEPDSSWIVYHAMTPPTKKVLKELGFE